MEAKIKKLVFEVQFDNESSPYHGKLFMQSYLKRFISFRQSLIANLRDYISVDVVPKQPPKHYSPVQVQGNNYLYHDLKHNKLVHFPRKGSFEVTIDNFLVFSRLQTGKWPDTETLTEWAFKVAQKMLDIEIDKERLIVQNSKQQIYPGRDTFTYRKMSDNSSERRRKSTNRSFIQQKLPRIGQSMDQRNSIVSNFSTLPVRPLSKNSNFTPQKHLLKQDISKEFSKNDFQKTKRVFRYSNNKQQAIIMYRASDSGHNINYYSDSKQHSKRQSFHWNLGTPLNVSVDKTNTRDGEFLRETVNRNKKIELEPLRKQILELEKTPFDTVKITKQVQEKIEKIELKVSQSNLNTFRGLYIIQDNLITKQTQVERWTPILCQNILPLKGQYYFTVGVVHSPQNTIRIGIVPLNYYPDALQKEERKDEFFIAYDCSNGMIRDSKLDQKCDVTSWRLGGDSAPSKKPYQMRITIDMDGKYIDWYIQEDIVASSKISQAFNQGFRVILNLAEEKDCIILNDENWRGRGKEEDGKFYLKQEQKKEEETNEQTENLPLQKIEIVKEELTIDEGIQTSFLGTIKKQRVGKFIQRKRNISAINDESTFEQQMLHQQNFRRLEQRLIYQNKVKDSKPVIEPKSNVTQLKIQNEIKPQQRRTQVEPKSIKAQTEIQQKNIGPLPLQTPQKNIQEISSPQKLVPQKQLKNQQPITKSQERKSIIMGVQQASKPKISKEQASKIQPQSKLQVAKSPAAEKILDPKPQVAKQNAKVVPILVVETEEMIEWVANFQDKSFKLKPKAINK